MSDVERNPDSETTDASAVSDPTDFLDRFGLSQFRTGQRDVVDAVLEGQHCLCIMPTGGGKSLCYQLPAIMLDGLTLVVSPLIALMKDQVDALHSKGIRAALINSTLSPQEQGERLDGIQQGAYDLLYVAPERFRSQRFVRLLNEANVRLLAIDEAHCISEWGHDFRHDYSRLGQYRKRIGNPPTIALTATATPNVQKDIITQLQLRDDEEVKVFVAGFARENLHYQVIQHGSQSEKYETVQRLVRRTEGSGIVYTSTRKACEEVAESVRQAGGGRSVVSYHAGLDKIDRQAAQESFMDGDADIVVATNAFGMGIDKPDVRFVIHFNMPGTLEAYYQEAGRAGRDGDKSECVLLYGSADQRIQKYFIESAYPARDVVQKVYDYLRSIPDDPIEITQMDLRERLGLDISNEGVGTCERVLEKAGAIHRLDPHRNMAVVRIDSDLPTILDLVPSRAINNRKVIREVEYLVGDARYEPVYTTLENLANKAGLKLPALRKSLAELSSLNAFHYVPPFRGRAIHVTDREMAFDEIPIDFEEMEARKQADYAKLRSMVGYANAARCRQWEILDYFGDPSGAPCGHCDNCDGSSGTQSQNQEIINIDEDDAIRMVSRIALSGVARARQQVGKNAVAAMLCGSQSAKIRKLRLDKVSTFGRLSALKQSDVSVFLDTLLRGGWLEQYEVTAHRPLLRLTELGRDLMVGDDFSGRVLLTPKLAKQLRRCWEMLVRQQPELADAASAPARVKDEEEHAEEDQAADEHEEEAAEIDESDSTEETPQEEPEGEEDAVEDASTEPIGDSGDSGISDRQFRTDDAELPAASLQSAPDNSEPAADDLPSMEGATYYWTWHLLDRGSYTAAEISAIRRLDADEFWEHLIEAHDNGLNVDLEKAMTPDELNACQSVTDACKGDLENMTAGTEEGTTRAQRSLFLRCQERRVKRGSTRSSKSTTTK